MSANENHPIEQELQREAARRRAELAGSEFELSAGARNALQAEVDRTYHRAEPLPTARWSWLGSVWTKLAFAGVGVLALVVGLQMAEHATPTSGPGDLARLEEDVARQESRLYRAESPEPMREAEELAEPSLSKSATRDREGSPVPRPAGRSADLGSAFYAEPPSRGLEESASAEAVPSVGPPEPEASQARRLAADTLRLETRPPTPLAEPAPASRPIVSTPPTRAVAMQAPASPVMQRFQLQVAGDQIVFIDDDGSRYAGSLQQQAAEAVDQDASTSVSRYGSAARYEGAATADSSRYGRRVGGQAARLLVQEGLFTAEGTNLTVRQNVKLTGRFYVQGVETNALTQDYLDRYGDLFQSVGNVLVLTGKAVVGETNEVPIHAETPTGN